MHFRFRALKSPLALSHLQFYPEHFHRGKDILCPMISDELHNEGSVSLYIRIMDYIKKIIHELFKLKPSNRIIANVGLNMFLNTGFFSSRPWWLLSIFLWFLLVALSVLGNSGGVCQTRIVIWGVISVRVICQWYISQLTLACDFYLSLTNEKHCRKQDKTLSWSIPKPFTNVIFLNDATLCYDSWVSAS